MGIRLFCCVGWALRKPTDSKLLCLIHAHSDGAGRLLTCVENKACEVFGSLVNGNDRSP